MMHVPIHIRGNLAFFFSVSEDRSRKLFRNANSVSVHMMSDARYLEHSHLLTLSKFSNFFLLFSNWRDITGTA